MSLTEEYLQKPLSKKLRKESVKKLVSSLLRKQDAPPPPLTPYHIPHSQNFEKIDTFLKSVLNICIPGT